MLPGQGAATPYAHPDLTAPPRHSAVKLLRTSRPPQRRARWRLLRPGLVWGCTALVAGSCICCGPHRSRTISASGLLAMHRPPASATVARPMSITSSQHAQLGRRACAGTHKSAPEAKALASRRAVVCTQQPCSARLCNGKQHPSLAQAPAAPTLCHPAASLARYSTSKGPGRR